jgi:hypothetical protein
MGAHTIHGCPYKPWVPIQFMGAHINHGCPYKSWVDPKHDIRRLKGKIHN